jgi:hypothetical protein
MRESVGQSIGLSARKVQVGNQVQLYQKVMSSNRFPFRFGSR